MKRINFKAAVVATMCALCTASFAQLGEIGVPEADSVSPKADARVKKALDNAGVKYQIDRDGDFVVVWKLDEGRSHLVFINSRTTKLENMELRKVWAPAFVVDEVSPNNMRALLELNTQYKVGAWGLKKQGGKYMAIFSLDVSANSAGSALKVFTKVMAITADEIEKTVTRADKY